MLDSNISSGGSNLSVGQRQILALARAMIRGSKLLILDEGINFLRHSNDSQFTFLFYSYICNRSDTLYIVVLRLF